ncbi:MAG: hypothetical protein IJD92_00695 [Bacilli bacterium]|nr:hypothetical protein [Bacilli bacterium]
MKKRILLIILIQAIVMSCYYYLVLPPINITSSAFWSFIVFSLAILVGLLTLNNFTGGLKTIFNKKRLKDYSLSVVIIIGLIIVIIAGISITNFICSPLFNAKSYSNRITINEDGNFTEDVEKVDFNSLPLLDRDSSEKLGDRVMGQMSDLVSQFYVSNGYTQINYNNDIIRVTSLEYADIIKWISNRKEGIKAYITVNSVNGESKLIKTEKGMKYMPSAFFNENLKRKLRFEFPTTIFGESKFEIDNEGNPYWITPIKKYTGVGLKTKIVGVVVLDPVTGETSKYNINEVPTWIDNAYDANLIIEQVDDWGTYKGGFFNSIFGQKNVVNTTEGYNYLAMNDDIYMYTGITSVLADESNLGFILTNMRTGETIFYSVPGAEEYSAMKSAEGQVQQMKYNSTFPLLINLNNNPTYLVSLKDAAGLVKMYGFVDVKDYQKVVVTDASKGIEVAAQNYLNTLDEEIKEDILITKEITIKNISTVVKSGNTYYYFMDELDKKYKASINVSEKLPFIENGNTINIGYYESKDDIIEIKKLY